MSKKIKQGGKREGAGRPKVKEATKVMRIPHSLVGEVEKLLRDASFSSQS